MGWIWSVVHGAIIFKESRKRIQKHPLEYGSIDEYEKANQVNLMDPVDMETFMKVTRDAESEWLEAS